MQEVINLKRAQITPKPFDLQECESKEDGLLASLNINESKKQCLKAIQKSTHSGKKNFHKGYVCIVCDQFIVGKEKVCWVNMKILLANEERLSVDKYQNTFQCVLPDTLRKQYLISSNALLDNMLLSPRASLASSRDKIMEKENKYSCCDSCQRSLSSKNKSTPPKFSIANGFAIGHFPKDFDEISDVIASMISRVRPFGYILSFQGGQGKRLKGTFTFFDNNIKQTEGVITHIQQKIPNNVLYCVMCGKFTPDQRQLARQRAKVNTEEFLKLYDWMRKNNFKFAQEPDEPKCPEPFIVEDKPTKQNTDDPLNPAIEKSVNSNTIFQVIQNQQNKVVHMMMKLHLQRPYWKEHNLPSYFILEDTVKST